MTPRTRIMYLENKAGGLRGDGRIGRVTFSKTGRTLRYRHLEFEPFTGYKANHFEVESGDEYWISGPRKDGQDTLYPGVVEIDDDVREEYWTEIRKRPDLTANASYRSLGKHHRRSG